MSHQENCPEPYEARRAGERAFERGGSRYSSGFDCDEAAYQYRRGYDRAEERRAEEDAEERAIARRRQEAMWADEESQALAQQEAEYYAAQDAAYDQQSAPNEPAPIESRGTPESESK